MAMGGFAQKMLRNMFDEIDTDGNGKLDRDEFNDLLERQGYRLSFREFNKLFESIDVDGNGDIDFDEFVAAMGNLSVKPDRTKQVQAAFHKYDHRRTGTVNLDDLLNTMKDLKLKTSGGDVIKALKMAGAAAPVNYDILISKFANLI